MPSDQPNSPMPTLSLNLEALALAQPVLCERLHWPVDGEHLTWGVDGRAILHYRGAELDAVLTRQEIERACQEVDPEARGSLFLFGVGLGELLDALLQRAPLASITAWERDPWLLRKALERHDWSAPLASGRLRLQMNADLTTDLASERPAAVVRHPLLARVYRNERILMEQGPGHARALVCTGTLFVDSIADSLRSQGFSVLSFDVQRISTEESEYVVQTWKPDLVVSVNCIDGLADFCEVHGLPNLTWEIDPALTGPRALRAPAELSHVFTYRRASVAAFQNAGYASVVYAPLAADPNKRAPQTVTGEAMRRYAAPVSFVGASLMGNVAEFQREFLARFLSWHAGSENEARAAMQRVLQLQRLDFSQYAIPACLDAVCPGFRQAEQSQGRIDPAHYLAEIAAAEKRLTYMAALAPHTPVVWGDGGWKQLEPHGIRHMGSALHETELPRIYSASAINVDVGRIYQSDIVTMRIFDILACGGFVLAEHSEALMELFEVGVEVESYANLAELKKKVAYYLEHPQAARAIAQRGRQAVLERHTIDQRIEAMLDWVALSRISQAA